MRAMGQADGSVIINTKLDADGFSEGANDIKGQFSALSMDANNIGVALSGGVSKSVAASLHRLRDLQIEVNQLAEELDNAFAQGLTPENSEETAKLERDYSKAYNKWQDEREKLRISVEKEAEKQANAEKKAAEKATAAQQKEAENTQKAAAGVIEQVGSGVGLGDLGGLIGGIVGSVGTANPVPAIIGAVLSGLSIIKNSLKSVFNTIKKVFNFVTAPLKKASRLLKRISTRIIGLVGSAFIFNGLSKAFRDLSDYLSTAMLKSGNLSQALANLKGALLQAAIPIIDALTPALVTLANTAAAVVSNIAQLFALFSGKIIKQISQTAKEFYNTANAAGKASKSVAGFDQLTKLSDNSGGGADSVLPNFDYVDDPNSGISGFFNQLKDKAEEQDWYGVGELIIGQIQSGLQNINWKDLGETAGQIAGGLLVALGGALAEVDIGAIGENLALFVSGLLNGLSAEIQKTDWSKIGADMMQGIADSWGFWGQFLGGILSGFSAITNVVAALSTAMAVGGPFTPLLLGISLVEAALAGLFSISAWLSIDHTEITRSTSEFVGSICGALFAAVKGAWEQLGEIASTIWSYIKENFIDSIDWGDAPWNIIAGLWDGLIEKLKDVGEWVETNVWEPFRDAFCEAAGINSPSTEAEAWGGDIIAGLFNGLLNGIESIEWMCDYIWQTIQGAFAGVGTWFETTFSNAWQTVLDVFSGDSATFEGIKESFSTTFKEVFNRLAEGINKVIQKPFNSINSMLNQISGWKIGNQTPFSGLWGYNPIAIPQIPYLAKGAVIPPNAPFMAVLGDQRHGTNIEAPLATIQEAVANVMEDYAASNMAGHSATVAVLQDILQAVLGIEIGDEVITSAVDRYQAKMAIVRGG